MAGDHDDLLLFDELMANSGQIVHILDFLSESGCTTALLMRFVPGSTAELAGALRLMAVHALLSADDDGSWDEPLMIRGPLRLTRRGEAVAQVSTQSGTTGVAHADRRSEHHTVLRRATDRVIGRRKRAEVAPAGA